MNKSRLLGAVCACAISFISVSAYAVGVSGKGTWETTLEGRDLDGNLITAEAYYDTVLGITWLADANYAGMTMDWATANSWATGLDPYGSGITGWRLPTMIGTPNCVVSRTGGTDCGWNVRTTSGSPPYPAATVYSEMASMYYDTLGNLALADPSTGITPQPGWGSYQLRPV